MLQTILFDFDISDRWRDFVLLDDLDILQYSCNKCTLVWFIHNPFGNSFRPIGESVIPLENIYHFPVISCSYVTLQYQINVVGTL